MLSKQDCILWTLGKSLFSKQNRIQERRFAREIALVAKNKLQENSTSQKKERNRVISPAILLIVYNTKWR